MERYDVAVIGTGPAGLEAAITAKVRNKKLILLGSKSLSPKVEKAHTVSNYLGLPEIAGDHMQSVFSEQIGRMGIEITEDRVNTVYAMGDYFAIQGHKETYEATTVILACGTTAAKPFPGELEYLGQGVSYCATCDAALYKGKTAIVAAYSREDEAEAGFLAEMAAQVYYVQMYRDVPEEESRNPDGVTVVKGKKPVKIEKDGGKMRLVFAEDSLEADGIFLLRESVAPSQLVPGLKLDGNHVQVDRMMRTNIDGLFACGDITGAPYQYIKAAGEGNVAALSAVDYLAKKRMKAN